MRHNDLGRVLLPVGAVAFLAVSCDSGAPKSSETSPPIVQTSQRLASSQPSGNAYAGFQLTLDQSVLAIGGGLSPDDDARYARLRTSQGSFAVDKRNGVVIAQAYPDSPARQRRPLGSSLADHNAFVREHFVSAGLPKDQIVGVGGFVHTRTLPVDPDSASKPETELVRYVSRVQRAIQGIRVMDSFAIASFNEDADATYEAVYWPPIEASVVDQALELRTSLSVSSALSNYQAALPADIDWKRAEGTTVIRHTLSAHSNRQFEAHAVYEIRFKSGPDGERQFDAEGREVSLKL